MKLIVGLGNPGEKYAWTRHNAGRHLVERIAHSEGVKWAWKATLQSSVASTRWESQEIFLARPDTFMNLSGEAVSRLVKHFTLEISRDLLIVIDDIAIPFGKLRLRGKGSDGGHNGLKSISLLLMTSDYARLRVGVAPDSAEKKIEDMAAYVLDLFDPGQKGSLDSVLQRGVEACRLWATEPLGAAMNVVNRYKQ